MAKKKILFVCLGNICRSPLAKGIFQHIVDEAGKADDYHIDAAGTLGYHAGAAPDHRSVQTAANYKIELKHKARQVREDDFYEFDLVIAMDRENYRELHRLRPEDANAKIMMMRYWDDAGKDEEVPDPYYGGISGFENVYQMLERSSRKLFRELEEQP